jgi:hypothetical protein
LRQEFEYRTFRRETQRPSPVQEWQTPAGVEAPRPPGELREPALERELPLEAQEAS